MHRLPRDRAEVIARVHGEIKIECAGARPIKSLKLGKGVYLSIFCSFSFFFSRHFTVHKQPMGWYWQREKSAQVYGARVRAASNWSLNNANAISVFNAGLSVRRLIGFKESPRVPLVSVTRPADKYWPPSFFLSRREEPFVSFFKRSCLSSRI